MGDKTQVITMTLALKYPINKILIGVALGSFANHGLAIVLGTMLSRIVPIDFLQLFAGTLFIIFAFYSLKISGSFFSTTNAVNPTVHFNLRIAFIP